MELEVDSTVTNNLEEEQVKFLDTTLGSAINNGIDVALRWLLPDYIEDTVIDLKDNLLNYGLKEGISESIQSVINTGKSAIGIFTGNFENVDQINTVIKSGGILDSVSDLLDDILDKIEESGKVNTTILDVIESGKDTILDNIEKNIESTLTSQITDSTALEEYMNNWKECYNNQDFDGMEKEYNKIQSKLKDLVPIETTINNARNIELLHNLIKNNGQDFNLTEEAQELATQLSLS